MFRGRKTWLNGCIEKSDHSRARVQKSDLDVTAYNAEPYYKRAMVLHENDWLGKSRISQILKNSPRLFFSFCSS